MLSCAETKAPAPAEFGTVGEEVYGVFCDRFGANTFREDLSGASFRALCHKTDGKYADDVDVSLLPPLDEKAYDASGAPVPLATQQAQRAQRISAMRRLSASRGDILDAIDAIASEELIDLKDLWSEGAASCGPSTERAKLVEEIGAMLRRIGPIYTDNSLLGVVQGADPVLASFSDTKGAIAGWRALRARMGYRPGADTFAGLRAVLAEEQLFDNLGDVLRTIGPHADPTNPRSEAGPGHAALLALMGTARAELLNLDAKERAHLTQALDAGGKYAPTRARNMLEFVSALASTESPSFKVGSKDRWLVRRDTRGVAWVAGTGSKINAPFVDADGDKRADVDAFGNLVGNELPTPFADLGSDPATARDARGVATVGGQPAYEASNVSQSWLAAALPELNGVFRANNNAWTKAARALPAALGPRAVSVRDYGDGTRVSYRGYDVSAAPLVDLVWAVTHASSVKETDRVLALMADMLETRPAAIARLARAGLKAKDIANADALGVYPANSMFWDEMLKTIGEIADVPGLLEAIVVNTADQRLAVTTDNLAKFVLNKDQFDYDSSNLNGLPRNLSSPGASGPVTPVDRSLPDTGDNRSIFQHFTQMVAELDGVALCTKEGAKAHIRGLPIVNTFDLPISGFYRECEVIKVDNLAHFYLQALVGSPKAAFNMRPKMMNLGVAPGTVDMLQRSSGILGFWNPVDSTVLTPKPAFVHRLAFFDVANDSPTEGSRNFVTNYFLRDLMPAKVGTNLCESRDIPDPCAGADCHGNDVRADGMVRGLRNCRAGEWLQDRHPKTVFALETGGLLESLIPLVKPFVDRGREDLFVRLMATMSKHWQSAKGTDAECRIAGGFCAKDGLSSYEPVLGAILTSDLVRALVAFSLEADSARVGVCTSTDAAGRCTATTQRPGIDLLGEAARALVSPAVSTTRNLSDRRGSTAVVWKDGSHGGQITPLLMIVNALSAADNAYAMLGEDGKVRQAAWREARSAIVDGLLQTTGEGASTVFSSKRFGAVAAASLRAYRGEAYARCPTSFVAPFAACQWLDAELNNEAKETLAGPLMANVSDVIDFTANDKFAVAALSDMLASFSDPARADDMVVPIAQSLIDSLGAAQDTRGVRAVLPVLTKAMDASISPQPLDAMITLLGRVGLSPIDGNGDKRCDQAIDPNRALPRLSIKAMTPFATGPHQGVTPLELLADAIADVNRASGERGAPLVDADYVAITGVLRHFLGSKENGMDQVITILKKALSQ